MKTKKNIMQDENIYNKLMKYLETNGWSHNVKRIINIMMNGKENCEKDHLRKNMRTIRYKKIKEI